MTYIIDSHEVKIINDIGECRQPIKEYQIPMFVEFCNYNYIHDLGSMIDYNNSRMILLISLHSGHIEFFRSYIESKKDDIYLCHDLLQFVEEKHRPLLMTYLIFNCQYETINYLKNVWFSEFEYYKLAPYYIYALCKQKDDKDAICILKIFDIYKPGWREK